MNLQAWAYQTNKENKMKMIKLLVIAIATVLLFACIPVSATSDPAGVSTVLPVVTVTTPLATSNLQAASTTSNAAAPVAAYVSNSGDNTVSVIDTATNTVTKTVKVGSSPSDVAESPDGSRVYVANQLDDTVSVIDTATNTVTDTVKVGPTPSGVAVSRDGSTVYVTNSGWYRLNSYGHNVSVIDTATNTVTATIQVGTTPDGVADSPDDSKVYVTNYNDGTVSVIDTATNTVTKTVKVGYQPSSVTASRDGSTVYVTNSGWSNFDSQNGQNGNVSVINTATNIVTATIQVGQRPIGVAVSTDDSKVYVTNSNDNTVSVIDTATNTVAKTVKVGSSPSDVAESLDGSRVYVTNYNDGTVSVIDTATNTVTKTVKVGYQPSSVAVSLGGSRVYIQPMDSVRNFMGNNFNDTMYVTTNGYMCFSDSKDLSPGSCTKEFRVWTKDSEFFVNMKTGVVESVEFRDAKPQSSTENKIEKDVAYAKAMKFAAQKCDGFSMEKWAQVDYNMAVPSDGIQGYVFALREKTPSTNPPVLLSHLIIMDVNPDTGEIFQYVNLKRTQEDSEYNAFTNSLKKYFDHITPTSN
jgi:YVTN family beta-propeller protein